MSITIKDPDVDREVRLLAEEAGTSLVGAIREAVANERARRRAGLAAPQTTELDDLVAAAKATRVPGASTELEWDEQGLPA